jgi:integrase
MRISEFCGLTLSDIDFENHSVNIDHQLQKGAHVGYYIEETKTESGQRKIPMTPEVEECFKTTNIFIPGFIPTAYKIAPKYAMICRLTEI